MDGVKTQDQESERRSPIPVAVLVVAVLIAVGAASALIFVLFKSTTGPGQTLRQYYSAVAAGDCDKAHGYLSTHLKAQVGKSAYCDSVRTATRRGLSSNIDIKVVTGFGEPPARFAHVTIVQKRPGPITLTWRMVREGSTWLVAQFPSAKCRTQNCEPVPL